ncbi:MAG TPA: hypothetical protein VGN00_12630 [Puia sp.]|jgi:hypothetical protein
MKTPTIHTTIEELSKSFLISQEVRKVCRENQIRTADQLMSYFLTHKSFKDFPRCRHSTRKELAQVARYLLKKVFPDFEEQKNNSANISDGELSGFGFSSRTFTLCRENHLLSPEDILAHYREHKTFTNILHFGPKTDKELVRFCRRKTDLKTNEQGPESLSPRQELAVNNYIEHLTSNLTPRSRNGLLKHFNGVPDRQRLLSEITHPSHDLLSIRNIGEKSITELTDFIAKVRDFTVKILATDERYLSHEYAKILAKLSSPGQFTAANGKVQLFKLISFLVEKDHLFRGNEKKVFTNMYSGGEMPNDKQIAAEASISSEYVRQIKKTIEENFSSRFSFVASLPADELLEYGISDCAICITIDPSMAEIINAQEGVAYNQLFYAAIFGLSLQKTHVPIENKISDAFKDRYFLQKAVAERFDITAMLEDLSERLTQPVKDSYDLDIDSYLKQFVTGGEQGQEPVSLHAIREVTEAILWEEFELDTTESGCIHIESNTRKYVHEYIEEILLEFNAVTRASEIQAALNSRYPFLHLTVESVRAAVVREKDLFISIGRSSMYGLKRWEKERAGLKGGTIRDIVEEYLSGESEPIHVYDITQHVNQFRDTTQLNVKTNLEQDDSNRFVVFPGEFFGLAMKEYKAPGTHRSVVGAHFITDKIRAFDGWLLDDVVTYYVEKYAYHPSQIRGIFERKIDAGEVGLTGENKITFQPA